jgi:2-methylisocitrate lyase-like PEP mutase family enzyme
MQPTSQADKAASFRRLHDRTRILVLPNAWDVASARLVEDAGAKVVATTSAGVAWSLGAPDGDLLARDAVLALIARVVAAVNVPVSADIENGFADTPEGVAETVEGVLAAGAVGINIEDTVVDHGAASGGGGGAQRLRPIAEQAERIAAARQAADSRSAPVALYINARIDTYLRPDIDPSGRLDETLARADAFVAAGASGVFVPGVADPAIVSALVKGIDAPLNILAGPGSPSISELAALGVARVSLGSSIAVAAYDLTRRAALEALSEGTYQAINGALTYGELNGLLGAPR